MRYPERQTSDNKRSLRTRSFLLVDCLRVAELKLIDRLKPGFIRQIHV